MSLLPRVLALMGSGETAPSLCQRGRTVFTPMTNIDSLSCTGSSTSPKAAR